ncbi:hypothetical protein MOMA_07036 [Moraxella macacae 0408225]|uniref:Uncharacterized protein n=1 Tax=Moraxella macacae 0408225 TaxID=1230338 RepID=L2F5J4_9GAMM|nr:hypothetical protein [Moraxella macacae]ELA08297.1 hypothetical protein MOMA_07036 [Moraxella macacae 0408225]
MLKTIVQQYPLHDGFYPWGLHINRIVRKTHKSRAWGRSVNRLPTHTHGENAVKSTICGGGFMRKIFRFYVIKSL